MRDPIRNHSDVPLVTVQIAMHSGDTKYALRCLDSVEVQASEIGPENIQCVIAFDGTPTPEDFMILEAATNNRSFQCFLGGSSEKTGYYCVPRNLAFPMSWGFYLAHLDADNEWLPGHLKGLLEAIRIPDREVGWPHFVYSRRVYVHDKDDVASGTMAPGTEGCPRGPSPLVAWEEGAPDVAKTPQNNFIDTGDFLIGRGALYELAERTGCVWNHECRRYGDWDLVCRLAAGGFRGRAVDQVTSRYHWTGDNLQLTRTLAEVNFLPSDVYDALKREGKIKDAPETGAEGEPC